MVDYLFPSYHTFVSESNSLIQIEISHYPLISDIYVDFIGSKYILQGITCSVRLSESHKIWSSKRDIHPVW